jgi:type IV pilus assembly protein PilA
MQIKRKGGFTLIELMIVVAIIGILAAIAIPNFLKFQLKAKTSEGKTNLAAIRTAEESYRAEFGVYVPAAVQPAAVSPGVKVPFNVTPAYALLGWQPEGNVYFNYYVGIDAGGLGTSFIATAAADLDGDTVDQVWGYKKGVAPPAGVNAASTNCVAAMLLVAEQVVSCAPTYGQSVF